MPDSDVYPTMEFLDAVKRRVEEECDECGRRHFAVDTLLERAEQLEKATREVAYEIRRMMTLGEVPQLPQIRWWYDHLAAALEVRDVG